VHLHYPDDLRKARVQGQVLARFVVDTTGRAEPGSFMVVRSSDPRFTFAVRQVITAMLYEPAQLGGHKVRQMVQQPFTFMLSPVDLTPP
jgi:protein TonB